MASDLFDELEMLVLRTCEIEERSDHETEHYRFDVYSAAIAKHSLHNTLVKALGGEGDLTLRRSMFVRLLGVVPTKDRRTILAAAGPDEFLERRSSELELLEVLESGAALDFGASLSVTSGSDWLQRRLATESERLDVLLLLADSGNTKRIRQLSREKAMRGTAERK